MIAYPAWAPVQFGPRQGVLGYSSRAELAIGTSMPASFLNAVARPRPLADHGSQLEVLADDAFAQFRHCGRGRRLLAFNCSPVPLGTGAPRGGGKVIPNLNDDSWNLAGGTIEDLHQTIALRA